MSQIDRFLEAALAKGQIRKAQIHGELSPDLAKAVAQHIGTGQVLGIHAAGTDAHLLTRERRQDGGIYYRVRTVSAIGPKGVGLAGGRQAIAREFERRCAVAPVVVEPAAPHARGGGLHRIMQEARKARGLSAP